MDVFTIFAAIALALPLALFAAIADRRQTGPGFQRRPLYAAVASRLKLRPSDTDVTGRIGDQTVRAYSTLAVSGARTIAACEISPPLDLGLVLASRHLPEAEAAQIGVAPAQPSDGAAGALDDRFTLLADDQRRAKKLLAGPFRQHLLATVETARVVVTDERIELQVSGLAHERYLVWALEAVAAMGEALAMARERVPSARSLLPLSPGYRREATEHGWRFARTPLGLWATVDAFDVFVGARRTGEGTYEGVAMARFPGSLGLGLAVRGTRLPGQDIGAASVDYLVGDALFDRVFIVAGDEPGPILELLTAELRDLLLAAADAGVVTLRDELVEVRLAAVPAPSSIKRWIETLTRLAALACARLDAETTRRGPYR